MSTHTKGETAWPEPMVERLKELYADGLPHSAISRVLTAEFGREVSRNASIGKVHRLGLGGRDNPQKGRKRAVVPPPKLKPKPLPPPPAPIPEPVKPGGEPVTVLTVRDGMCKWPIGDPLAPGFRFCGHRTKPGKPYCAGHTQLAWQPRARKREAV